MQDRKYNKQPVNGHDDPFLAYFKDSLQDHQLPVDDNRWEELNQRLQRASRKKKLRLMIVYPGVAAAVALLVILSGLFNNKPVEPGLLSMTMPPVKGTLDQAISDQSISSQKTSNRMKSDQVTSDQLTGSVQPSGFNGTNPMRLVVPAVLSKPVWKVRKTGEAVLLTANDAATNTPENKENTCDSVVSAGMGNTAAMAATTAADSSAFNYAVNPRTRQTEKGRSAAEQENLLAFNSRRPKNSDWAFGAS
ncbi:MAG: hypothetical protein Q8914_06610, partial [Bacteroidota bacterium]|nr:hypothetical protein [Bacteroidota bacterium]